MHVSAYMRCHALTLPWNAALEEIVRAFDVYQQPVVPVVDAEQSYLGVLWPKDVARWLGSHGSERAAGTGFVQAQARDLMDSSCPTCLPDDDVATVAGMMQEAGASAAVVLEDCRVVGFIGWPEVCAAVFDSLTGFPGCDASHRDRE